MTVAPAEAGPNSQHAPAKENDKSQFDLQILIWRGDPLRHLTVPPLPEGEALRGSSFGGAVSEADWEGPLYTNLHFKF